MANNVTDLGKVGITLKGEWNASTSYERLDAVTYQGSLYIAIKNNVNANPSTSTTNWMLSAKHGEFTEQQLEDFKAEVVAESKEEMDDYTDNKKAELDTYEDTKETELNEYATELKNTFDTNASAKTSDFNDNATAKTTAFNTNASDKTDAFDTNASTKTTAFDNNATSKTTAFNTNATNKTTDYNDNATAKTTAFDTNATNKTNAFDDNASDKTDDFNDNATAKTTAFDNNATAKTEAFDEHTEEIQADIEDLQNEVEELSANMPWNTTEQATDIQVTDAAKYSRNKLELFGNTEQDNTKMTYKCDGTETGDYYLTYNSIDYYFTMPTIVNGDILVFNTTDLKLYLGDTEITTESTGTGTNLTFISSPNSDYPQNIHVVTGNNTVEVQGKNLFDKNNANIESLNASFTNEGYFSGATNQKHVYIKCKPNTRYTISKNYSKNWAEGIYITEKVPATGVWGKRLYWGDFNIPRTVLTPDNAEYLDVRLTTSKGETEHITEILEGLQIEEGSIGTDYVSYYHEDYPIDLRGKNKFDITKITPNTYIGNNGTTGTSVATNLSDYIYVQGNKEYTLSYKCDNFESSSNRSLVFYTLNKQHISGVYYNPANKLFTFTPTQDGYIRFGYDINCYDIQVEEGSVTEYEPYNSIELCEIGDYQDKFVKDNGVWKIPNKIVKIDSYNGETITTPYISSTGGLDIGATIYYVGNAEYIITDTTLIAQLDAIYEHLQLVKGTNNITVTASDLAPNMQLSYMQDLPSKLNNLASRIELLEE